jgi:alpha-1,3-mannosyltransferase
MYQNNISHYYYIHYHFLINIIIVSVKMNILLQSPGVLLVLLIGCGFQETFICLSICALLQLILGYPFLSTYPYEYLKNSFDIGRVFMFQWTVNWKFLNEEFFVSKTLAIVLLLFTILGKGVIQLII